MKPLVLPLPVDREAVHGHLDLVERSSEGEDILRPCCELGRAPSDLLTGAVGAQAERERPEPIGRESR